MKNQRRLRGLYRVDFPGISDIKYAFYYVRGHEVWLFRDRRFDVMNGVHPYIWTKLSWDPNPDVRKWGTEWTNNRRRASKFEFLLLTGYVFKKP